VQAGEQQRHHRHVHHQRGAEHKECWTHNEQQSQQKRMDSNAPSQTIKAQRGHNGKERAKRQAECRFIECSEDGEQQRQAILSKRRMRVRSERVKNTEREPFPRSQDSRFACHARDAEEEMLVDIDCAIGKRGNNRDNHGGQQCIDSCLLPTYAAFYRISQCL
jgi:hypothetical protein